MSVSVCSVSASYRYRGGGATETWVRACAGGLSYPMERIRQRWPAELVELVPVRCGSVPRPLNKEADGDRTRAGDAASGS